MIFENLVATALLKHSEYLRDFEGKETGLHYIRTKDGAEIDFALSESQDITTLVECKLSDSSAHKALLRFAEQFPNAQAVQLVRDLRHPRETGNVTITKAAEWLNRLAA